MKIKPIFIHDGIRYVGVPAEEYIKLKLTKVRMNLLEAAGIDNTDAYSFAFENYDQDKKEYDLRVEVFGKNAADEWSNS